MYAISRLGPAIISLAFLAATSPASAAVKNQATTEAQKRVTQTAQTQTAEQRQKILEEATQAIQETNSALRAIDKKNKKDALQSLERATGKLEIILARDRSLSLAPASVAVITQDVLADADLVKKMRKQAEDLLEDGRLQEARYLIRDLGSETVISVTNIPLATYPAAVKEAAKLVDQGKFDDAKRTLEVALNTLVVTNTVIPLPVATAEELLKDAEKLSSKANRTEDENKRLKSLIDDVRSELKLAQEYGYGTKKDFKNLYSQLDELESKTKGGKSESGIFSKINASISELMKKFKSGESGKKPETKKQS